MAEEKASEEHADEMTEYLRLLWESKRTAASAEHCGLIAQQ